MEKPVTIRLEWLPGRYDYQFWFKFEDKVFVQHSEDGIEWDEAELTPFPEIPFVAVNVEPWPDVSYEDLSHGKD